MTTKTLFSLAMAAFVASCSNDVVVSEKSDTPIRITTSLDKQTRGYNSSTEITDFKMSAFKNNGSHDAWIDNVDVTKAVDHILFRDP